MAEATPAAAELAKVNDVDLDEVEGTGKDGQITVGDVRSYIEDRGDEVVPVDEETIEKLRAEGGGVEATPLGEDTGLSSGQAGVSPANDQLVPVAQPEDLDYGNLTPASGEDYTPPDVDDLEDFEGDEVETVVREGMFVRVKAEEAPGRLVGSDFSVERAAVRRTTGPSKISNDRVEYQLPGDPLLIKARNTGELFEVRRDQVELQANDRSEFGTR